LRFDIEMTRKMGFNMCRKHVKVEPARWYYWADKLGLMVWQDMPSGFAEGANQNVRPGGADDAAFSDELAEGFQAEWAEIMETLMGHPCLGRRPRVCCMTPNA
jgi:beta-galactosidase/beta-glucuronidase